MDGRMDAWMDGPVRSLLWLIHSIKTLVIFFFFFFGAWSLFQQEIGSGSFTSAEFLPGSHFFLQKNSGLPLQIRTQTVVGMQSWLGERIRRMQRRRFPFNRFYEED